jgi:DNA-directed RNA polymerase I, II, and III subunit RPABC2
MSSKKVDTKKNLKNIVPENKEQNENVPLAIIKTENNKAIEENDFKEENKGYTDAYDFYKNYDTTKNVFSPYMTIYEKAAIIGIRATQISEGSPVLVDVPEGIEDVIQIAEMELAQKKLCMIVCRENREYWRVCDLIDNNPE